MKSYSLLLSALVLGAVVAVAPQPAAAANKSEQLETIVNGVKTNMQENYKTLSDEDQTQIYTVRYTETTAALAEVEDTLVEAQAYVPSVYFANVQEKKAMYAVLSGMIAQIEYYSKQVEDINTTYTVDGDEDAANAALTTVREDAANYLKSNKNDFSNLIKKFLRLKLDSGLYYTDVALDALTESETAYTNLGADVSKVTPRLDRAEVLLNTANSYYDSGTKGTTNESDDDLSDLNRAAFNLLRARALTASAQYQVKLIQDTYVPVE